MQHLELKYRSVRWGTPFQVMMIFSFIICTWIFGWAPGYTGLWHIIDYSGLALAAWCLFWLYFRNIVRSLFRMPDDIQLITWGPFKYTRHPMYTGILLMDTVFWLPAPVSTSPLFYVLQAAFFIGLVVAGYCQEQETLARFGDEARAYYARTPRFFFTYPLIWIQRLIIY